METTFSAPGITCHGCAGSIEKALGAMAGVSGVIVDVAGKAVTVRHDACVGPEGLVETLSRAGYPARLVPARAALPIVQGRPKAGLPDSCCCGPEGRGR